MIRRSSPATGFSLVELLLVLAIIGILGTLAIPAFLGQRRRAKTSGDAIANAKVLSGMLENRKAEAGVYGTKGQVNKWTHSGTVPAASTNLAPGFTPKGNTLMDYTVTVGSTGLTFVLSVTEPNYGLVYKTDQTQAALFKAQ